MTDMDCSNFTSVVEGPEVSRDEVSDCELSGGETEKDEAGVGTTTGKNTDGTGTVLARGRIVAYFCSEGSPGEDENEGKCGE